ncbi:hypothetical protein N4G69_55530, partial [Streptomyces mirabilis]|nr:hypothetical protein [Streptomyces mirabilis]
AAEAGAAVQLRGVPVADGPGFMARWAAAGVVGQVRAALTGRIRDGRRTNAVATIIDSQSAKVASSVSGRKYIS